MKDTIKIKTTSLEGRNSLLGALFAMGFIFHKGEHDYSNVANTERKFPFSKWDIVSVHPDKDITFNNQYYRGNLDFNWPENAKEIFEEIDIEQVKNEKPTEIILGDILDYDVKINADGLSIYDTLLSFEKFEEIAAAVDKVQNI